MAAGSPQGQVPARQQAEATAERFTSAINAGRILPTDPDNAFAALRDLQKVATPEQYQERENQLRVALEDKAQGVLAAISGRR